MNSLRLENISIFLPMTGQALLRDLSLEVRAGDITTVMGRSGAGKSTLLAFIAGHMDPAFKATGKVFCGDRNITHLPPEARRVGILFQDDMLFPHLSVGSNLAYGLTSDIRGREARRACVEAALDDAGLAGFANRDPATLSGGQRIRVALMRTLLSRPAVLLLDEPFSKLDKALRIDMQTFVFECVRRQRLPVLMVTHDEDDARIAQADTVRI